MLVYVSTPNYALSVVVGLMPILLILDALLVKECDWVVNCDWLLFQL